MMSLTHMLLSVAFFVSSFFNGTLAAPISSSKRSNGLSFDFDNDKVRGVNLGGWFVLEPWITPSIFEALPDDVVDQWSMASYLGPSKMKSQMEKHWKTWITEDDFAEMASYGLNFVRIPIGYWSILPLPGDPYIMGAYEYLAKAIEWAGSHGIKVMIDLHGAPESQNGFDNSGNRGSINWGNGDSIEHTKNTLNKIRDDHASNPAVAAIELVNEPMGPVVGTNVVTQFYADGWGNLKDSNVAITFHDAFEGIDAWSDFGSGMWSLMLDTHHYEIFDSSWLEMDLNAHIANATGFGEQMATMNKWTIAGEWTGAMTDCTKWLNGKNNGARYDGTYEDSYYIGSCDGKTAGTVADLSEEDKSDLSQFIQAQMNAFEKANGWIFWTWKTESSPEWDFQALSQAGVMPHVG